MKKIDLDHCGAQCSHYADRCWFDYFYDGSPGRSVTPIGGGIEWDGVWGDGCLKANRIIPPGRPDGNFPDWCPLPDAEEGDDA